MDSTTPAFAREHQGRGEIRRQKLLALTPLVLREQRIAGKHATEDQLHGLEGIRRLLLQVVAVHALSWPLAG